jgi:hypothetical protein
VHQRLRCTIHSSSNESPAGAPTRCLPIIFRSAKDLPARSRNGLSHRVAHPANRHRNPHSPLPPASALLQKKKGKHYAAQETDRTGL